MYGIQEGYRKMSHLHIFPPYFHVNQQFKKNASKNKFENGNKELHIKEIVKNASSMASFLSNHPMPCYQGPFMNPIGLKTLGESFASFTTFQHSDDVTCGTWTVENPADRIFQKHTKVSDKDLDNIHLVGPASKLDFSIVFTCQLGGCKIGCGCMICTTPRTCERASCGKTPCDECNLQCPKHRIGLLRTFDEQRDLFTLVVAISEETSTKAGPEAGPEADLLDDKHFILKKYSNIPRDCQECAKDIEDHELHHKIFHSRCRFCRKDSRFIDYSASYKHMREKRKAFETKDDETCSSCFKIFATKYVRKKHEQEAHKERKQKCSICSRSFQSKISLDHHIKTYHDSSIQTFKCSVCEKILSTQQILKRHIQTVHEKETFSCEKCGKHFSRINYYNRHLREAHSIEQKLNLHYATPEFLYKFNCDQCEEKFNRCETLKRHVETIHGDNDHEHKEYKCNFCMKTFNRNDNKRRHETRCPENKKE